MSTLILLFSAFSLTEASSWCSSDSFDTSVNPFTIRPLALLPDCRLEHLFEVDLARELFYERLVGEGETECDALMYEIIQSKMPESSLIEAFTAENVNCEGWAGYSPIFDAIEQQKWNLVLHLLRLGARTDAIHPAVGYRPFFAFMEQVIKHELKLDCPEMIEIFDLLLGGQQCIGLGSSDEPWYVPTFAAYSGSRKGLQILEMLAERQCNVPFERYVDLEASLPALPLPRNEIGEGLRTDFGGKLADPITERIQRFARNAIQTEPLNMQQS